ncbi:hypothetical protein SIN8267_03449 [Sinobacterium norvegicum]|uniref:Sugar transporter n=1 Tax=Sinobacterium norvegicum TaxID=1641715 RepID=A0ABN8ELN6_9GAMM|nr:polysaccharide biosynthesis/export family protein [Sinobacterium norvegicum]CAH0993301.1 hypothetical protein SIN8267_03449 [Sinobacterium norvegicum]
MTKLLAVFIGSLAIVLSAYAQDESSGIYGDYEVNPGDILSVFIWGEEGLSKEVVVRPDGFVSYPLAGEIEVGGQTITQVTASLERALATYMKSGAQVTVSMTQMSGNNIYVIGKVNKPGVFNMFAETDVSQALALAGGLNTFADENDIKVLRRDKTGVQTSIDFNYKAIRKGKDLSSNVILRSGDVVVVP